MAEDQPMCLDDIKCLDDIRSSDKIQMSKPRIKDLQNFITPKYASLWKEIGIQLGIAVEKLETIKMVYPTIPEKCCIDMWKHWCECHTDALWHKVITAIDSPQIVAAVKNFNRVSLPLMDTLVNEAVSDFACRLKMTSINNRYKNDDNWPLFSPQNFTSVALIHHKGQQTKREVLAVASLLKRGDFDLNKLHTADEYFKQSKCTKDISEIFKVEYADSTTKFPSIILIEGVPGIGKTTLSKEIVFQWANGRLLSDKMLVFLIHLRDTESHKINSLESFVNYVSYPQVAGHILQYIIDSKGKNIVIVFDGYDEISHELRNNSFHYKIMTRSIIEMPLCTVVITSRPNASACLHDKTDLRVEILGFTNEDRKAYIGDALKDNDDMIRRVVKYLNDNPSIDSYCYIPLNMTILLSFFKNSDLDDVSELPNTQTRINEKFVCTTISRYIRREKELTLNFSNFSEIQTPCDNHEMGTPCVGHEKGVPYGKIFKEISKLAFKALRKDKIVFTTTELQESCPCLESYTKNWDGLGLLKSVQFFDFKNNLRNVSFNFLHFTIQEILAAYHITLMSEDDQIICMEETFWSNRYYNTWIMYVGLTENQLPIAFKHFLSGSRYLAFTRWNDWWKGGTYCCINKVIVNDKIKCLHLFQCFSETENKDLCQHVGQLLQKNEIDISNQTLSARNVLTISLFLTRSTTKQWKVLNLSNCFIGDNGIKQLYNSFTSNNRSKVYINELNLSHNNLTQFSIEYISGLIVEWNVKDVILDNVDQHHLNEQIMHQIMQYPVEQNNFIICNFNKNATLFARLSEKEYLILGFNGSLSKEVVDKIATTFRKQQASIKDFKTIKFDTIICLLHNCTRISYLNMGVEISQFKLSNLVELIRNNKFMEYLYLPKWQYTILNEPAEPKMILDALKPNISLKCIDISFITIDSDLVKEVVTVMKNKSKLKEIIVSALLLRYDDFMHLENYLPKITSLKVFSISGYIFTPQDADSLAIAMSKNYCKIQQLSLSNCKIPIEHLIKILSYKSVANNLKWLNLSGCQLDSKELKQILKQIRYLHHVDLSGNFMKSDAINEMVAMISNNQCIQSLSLPSCLLNQEELRIIIQAMQTASSLQYVDFNTNKLNSKLANDVVTLFVNNSTVEQINISKLILNHYDFQDIKYCLVRLKGIKYLKITGCTFTIQDLTLLETFICRNHSVQEVVISNCKINDQKVIAAVTGNDIVFDQLESLELSNSRTINLFVPTLSFFLSCSSKLKHVILCNCQLQPSETNQILKVLKHMGHLECVDLSGNTMTDDSVSYMEAMIVRNKHLQKLCLPNCILNQSNLRIIIQAMQTMSSLQYVDFSTNKVDDLAGDVAVLISNNSQLKNLNFSQLLLGQNCFQHLKNYLERFKGLKFISINCCNFSRQDADRLVTAGNHFEIYGLSLSNCTIHINALLSIISYNIRLRWLDLSNCHLNAKEIKRIFSILKLMNNLQCVNLSANSMTDDVAKDIAAVIIKNKNIQEIHLPDCILKQTSLTIIIQAMQTVSLLHYVDFSTSIIGNELVSNIALVITNNLNLKRLKFSGVTLNQNNFQHIKNYLTKIEGLKVFTIVGCTFTRQDGADITSFLTNSFKIQELNLTNCKMHTDHLLPILYWNKELKKLDLSNCQLHSKQIKRIVSVLKQISNLSHVDLSGNFMKSDASNEIRTMIKNNKHIQSLSLPICILSQKDLRIIVQAMQRISSLQYVDFNNNRLDNELASDVALLMTNNSELRELKFSQVTLHHSGFQQLSNHLVKIKILRLFSITNCYFTRENVVKMLTVFNSNSEIQEIDLSNCIMPADQSVSVLSCTTKLRWLNLSNCLFQSNEITKILNVLKEMKYLQHIDLSANNMRDDVINQIAAMIENNRNIQLLSLPTCTHKWSQEDFRVIIQAMHTVSSLQHVNFNTSFEVDNELASDVATLFANNSKLEQLNICKLKLKQSGFKHLKMYFFKLKGLKYLTITDVMLTDPDIFNVETVICNNEIQELIFSNCKLIEHNVITVPNNSDIYYHDHQLEQLEFNNSSVISSFILNVLIFLLHCFKLKQIILCNCQLQANEIKEVFMVLKYKRDLVCIDLSGNAMKDDSISEIKAMIDNNKKLQRICLPNCSLDQENLRIIIQAMQTVSSLQIIDFNANKINGDLAKDVAILIDNNTKLEVIKFSTLELDQNGFNILKSYLMIFKGMRHFKITSCTFIDQDVRNIIVSIDNNLNIQELDLSYNEGLEVDMLCIVSKLKTLSLLRCLRLNKIAITKKVEHEIITVIHNNNNLKYLEMSRCNLSNNFIKDIHCRNIQFKF